MAENFDKRPTAEEELDELIRSMKRELDESDARMEQKTPSAPVKQEPAFQPELPREYAELTLDEPEKEEKAKPSGVTSGRRTFIYVAAVLLASMALAFFMWVCLDDACALTREDSIVAVTVKDGDTVGDVANALADAGLIRQKWLFRLYCDISHAERRIIPGTYELNAIFDYHALVNGMASTGRRATATVTVPEGYECREIFALLEEKGVCSAEALWQAAANGNFDYRFLEGVPAGDKNRLEGCLFPDTYEFYLDDTPESVLGKLLNNTDEKLTEDHWAALDALNAALRTKKANAGFGQDAIASGNLTMHDILIVASLIERETAGSEENEVIASVIYNRLCSKAYPCLNIDATIQYILPERKEFLSDADKLIDSPYNTYKYPGLPAGAIANAGADAIHGALYPAETDYYFYALGKDGKHKFSTTYDEHLAFLEELQHE